MTTKQTSEPQSAPVALIGAGPIGIELAVGLKRAGVDVLHFDARQINGRHPPHKTDFVLLNTGFHGDQILLKMAGVTLGGENRIPLFDPAIMRTNIPGLHLAGTVAAGVQPRPHIQDRAGDHGSRGGGGGGWRRGIMHWGGRRFG